MKRMASGLTVAAAMLVFIVAHPAQADDLGQSNDPPQPTTVISIAGKAAKAQSSARRAEKAKPGDRFLFAVVQFNGVLDRGSGVKQALRADLGSYRVFFNRDVTRCSHVVSVSGTGTDDVHGVADAAQVSGKPRG